MTHDKNGTIIKCGDIVEISNAYFNNDCGFWFVEQDGTNESYTGRGLTLRKIGKTGKISTAKYNIAFWPLSACTNDREKNAAAREHNAQNATIEIVKHISTAAVIDYIRDQIKEIDEAIKHYTMRGYAETFTESHRKARDYWTNALERLTQPTESPEVGETTPAHVESYTEAERTTETAGTPEAVEEPAQPEEAPTDPNNYYIENKETGKIELHFEKEYYLNLDESQKKEIKSNFLFSRHSGAWISRRKFPNLFWPKKVAESLGLANLGAEGERRTFAEQMEVKAAKAEYRAERMEYKAEAAEKRGESLQTPINRMHGDIAFFTQPNISTSAGRAFTRQRNRMWEQYERGMEEFRKSDYYRERATVARTTASQAETKDKGFCQRRIDEAEKTIRAQKKNLAIYEDKLQRIESGETVKTWRGDIITAEEVTRWIEDTNDIINEAVGKVAYYDALIQAAGGIIDRNQIKPGDMVKIRHNWIVKVISTRGAKNFTFEFLESHMRYADGTQMQGKAAYAEIKEIVKTA